MEKLKDKLYQLKEFIELSSILEKNDDVHLSGLQGSFRAFVISRLYEKNRYPVLYVANDLDSAERLKDDLELIVGPANVSYLPALHFEPYDHQDPNPSQVSMRLETIEKCIAEESWIIVATIEGILEHFPRAESFLDQQIYLKTGMDIDFEQLVNQLAAAGFERQDVVEQVGEFCVRGGLIDVYSWNAEDPFRIEFFGNEVESIRSFDVISQRSLKNNNELTILPHLSGSQENTFIDEIIPDSTIVFFEDSMVVESIVNEFWDKAHKQYDYNITAGVEELKPDAIFLGPDKIHKLLTGFKRIDTNLVKKEASNEIDFKVKPHPDFAGSVKNFIKYLNEQSRPQNPRFIYLQSANQHHVERLKEIIDEEEIDFYGAHLEKSLHNGFRLDQLNLEILTDHEIFRRFKRRRTYKRFKSGEYLRQLSSLNLYDYVVHIDYGVGQYLGMETIEFGSVKKECLKIGYQDDDFLFVTVDRLNRVQKFSSEENVKPKLTKLGTTEWERTKKKTKESLKKVAAELIRIYAGRKAQGGFSFSQDKLWQNELEASFMFEETEDQLKSIGEVKADMERDEPMDRLLCGDVGFGKTEVAIRAAFKAVMDGKQVAVLVPTTILAFQHFETFKVRLSEFPIEIEMLNRFRTAAEQRKILAKLAEGSLDIIIGTHRLLSEDVHYKDLGLLVVDEEQRFGVKQKEKIKKYRLSVDILSMTATPIPRTLHMALMGARDLSNIDTPPRNRLPVQTEIMYWDEDKLHYILNKELARGGQVYFVHNRVETIQAVKESIQQIVPQAKIDIGHGQLPERQLEKVMFDFMHKKFNILVATMIIENGLDIPNVNTIIVNHADKFGLAQLYQLRGRVGRSDQQAYAYLLIPPIEKITEVARKRLHAIQDFTDLGSGYRVALRDLEIRGAGNLLGKEQSGFVQTIGFDLYCKILDEAVEELKKGSLTETPAEKLEGKDKKFTDPKLDVDFDLLIPEDFIASDLERITVYHRLVNFSRTNQIENMREELADRFGKLPAQVGDFLTTIEIKVLASYMYAQRIIIKDNMLKLIFDESAQNDDDFFKRTIPYMMQQKLTPIKFLNQDKLGVEMNIQSKHDRLEFAKKILENIIENN